MQHNAIEDIPSEAVDSNPAQTNLASNYQRNRQYGGGDRDNITGSGRKGFERGGRDNIGGRGRGDMVAGGSRGHGVIHTVAGAGRGRGDTVAGGGRGRGDIHMEAGGGRGRGDIHTVAGGGRGRGDAVSGGGRGRGDIRMEAGGGRGRGDIHTVAGGGRGRGDTIAGVGRGRGDTVSGGGRGRGDTVAGGGRGRGDTVAGGGRGRGDTVAGGGRGCGDMASGVAQSVYSIVKLKCSDPEVLETKSSQNIMIAINEIVTEPVLSVSNPTGNGYVWLNFGTKEAANAAVAAIAENGLFGLLSFSATLKGSGKTVGREQSQEPVDKSLLCLNPGYIDKATRKRIFCPYSNCSLFHYLREVPCVNGDNCENNLCTQAHPGSCLELELQKRTVSTVRGFRRIASATVEVRKKHRNKIKEAQKLVLKEAEIDVNSGAYRIDDPRVLRVKELRLQLSSFDDAVFSIWSKLGPEPTLGTTIIDGKKGVNDEMRSQTDFIVVADEEVAVSSGPPVKLRRQKSVELVAHNQAKHRVYREIYRLESALPALALRSEIVNTIREHSNLVIRGATGSGKSTQVTQYLAEMVKFQQLPGRRVICTQPRKVAAEGLAGRVSEEWYNAHPKKNEMLGNDVGYRVGDKKMSSSRTIIEYVTEGTLLNSLLRARKNTNPNAIHPLRGVSAVILDEAHERSVTLDLIIALLKEGQQNGSWGELRLVVTSATLDAQLFSRYLLDAPVIDIPGRMFPVEIIYRPMKDSDDDYVSAGVKIAFEIHKTTPISSGDILVFLTGEVECLKACDLFEKLANRDDGRQAYRALPLYGKQSREEQALVLSKPDSRSRKIVFSTDVAETSLTIDGVRHVVDSGMSKESVYDTKRNVTVLTTRQISQSSATQRKGRAGRTSSGFCYRLYSQEDEATMNATQLAEVLSRPLELTIVTARAMGLDPFHLDWIERPNRDALLNAENDLVYLEVIDPLTKELTEIGHLTAALQMDPSLARLLYFGCKEGYGEDAALIGALISVGSNILWRPSKTAQTEEIMKQVAERHNAFMSSDWGDVVSYRNIFKQYKQFRDGSLQIPEGSHSSPVIDVIADQLEAVDIADVILDDLAIGFENTDTSIFPKLSDANDEDDGNDGYAVDEINEHIEAADIDGSDDDSLSLPSEDDDRSVASNESAETIDSINSVEEMQIEEEIAEAREEEKQERFEKQLQGSKAAKKWCAENFINLKAIGLVESTRRELIRNAKTVGIWAASSSCSEALQQDRRLDEEGICRLVVKAFLLNIASKTGSLGAGGEYNILRTDRQSKGRVHLGSAIGSRGSEYPTWICYNNIMETNNRTFLSIITPLKESWLEENSAAFTKVIRARCAQVLDSFSLHNVVPAVLRRIVGYRRDQGLIDVASRIGAVEVAIDSINQCLIVYCKAGDKGHVYERTSNLIKDVQLLLTHEIVEEAYSSSVRACYRPGMATDFLLFEGEMISLILCKLPATITAQQLSEFVQRMTGFEQFREVTILKQDHEFSTGKVVFFTKEQAAAAKIALTGVVVEGGVSPIIVKPGGLATSSPTTTVMAKATVTVRMQWSLCPSYRDRTGHSSAIVVFLNEREVQSAVEVINANGGRESPRAQPMIAPAASKLKAIDKAATVVAASEITALKLFNLQPTADEEDVIEFLRAMKLPLPVCVTISRIKQEQSGTATATTLNEAIAEITNMIPSRELVTGAQSFFTSQNKRAGLELKFDTDENRMRVLSEWEILRRQQVRGQYLRHDHKIRLYAEYMREFVLERNIFDFLASEIHSALFASRSGHGIMYRVLDGFQRQKKIRVSGLVEVDVQLVAADIEKILTPTLLVHNRIAILMTADGQNLLNDATKRFKLMSSINKHRNSVLLYGNSCGRDSCAAFLSSELDRASRMEVSWTGWVKKRSIRLAKEKRKEWQIKYSFLSILLIGLELKVIGLENDIVRFRDDFKQILTSSNEGRGIRPEEDEMCNLCYCPLEEPIANSLCGHRSCKVCLKGMVLGAESRLEVTLPLSCVQCNSGYAVDDIKALTTEHAFSFIKESSVGKYVLKHKDRGEIMYCPRPDCGNILDLSRILRPTDYQQESKLGGHVAYCSTCVQAYCINCSNRDGKFVPQHCGSSCDMAGSKDVPELREYLRKIENRLYTRCPRCLSVFLDFDGCFALKCSNGNCGIGFCAFCLMDCDKDAHGHVRVCPLNPKPGEYFHDKEVFNDCHRKRYAGMIRQELKGIADLEMRERVLVELRKSTLPGLGIVIDKLV